MNKYKTFEVTDDHLILARRFYVGWNEGEFGAPTIDCKRPYGNSSVLNDIHEILTGESIGMIDSKRDELTEEEKQQYDKIHLEMETVLQIILATGQFKSGHYICKWYGRNWKEFKNHE